MTTIATLTARPTMMTTMATAMTTTTIKSGVVRVVDDVDIIECRKGNVRFYLTASPFR